MAIYRRLYVICVSRPVIFHVFARLINFYAPQALCLRVFIGDDQSLVLTCRQTLVAISTA